MCLYNFPHLPLNSIFPSKMFYMAVRTQNTTNRNVLPSYYYQMHISVTLDTILYYFISHAFAPNYLHLSPTQHFKFSSYL